MCNLDTSQEKAKTCVKKCTQRRGHLPTDTAEVARRLFNKYCQEYLYTIQYLSTFFCFIQLFSQSCTSQQQKDTKLYYTYQSSLKKFEEKKSNNSFVLINSIYSSY